MFPNTKEKYDKFFENLALVNSADPILGIDIEMLYQAFKARLIEELSIRRPHVNVL